MVAKKPRRAEPARAASRLAALPPILLENVLQYLVDDDALVGNANRHYFQKFEEFRAMARVSTEWRVIADEAASARVLRVLYIKSEYRCIWMEQHTRSEMLEIRRQVILRRAHLQRLVVGDSPDYGIIGCAVWSAALSHVPKLKSLELATIHFESRPSDSIVDITQAAVRHCHQLQTLTIPHSLRQPAAGDTRRPRGHHLRALSKVVYGGLKVWFSHTGGLRRLCFPMQEIMKSGKDAATYLDHVVRYCPQITDLDGVAFERRSSPGGEELWKLDLVTWERFCGTCSQLSAVYWSCVPFATQFFEVFGAHAKPNLRFLSLATSNNWKWDQYFKAVGAATATTIKATGYGVTAVHPERVLHATPNLEVLRVECGESSRWIRAQPLVDPEVFGDGFIEAAVELCKKLKFVTHWAVGMDDVGIVETFTDRSLRALATLSDLEWLDVGAVNISGDGLFDLVANHAARTRRSRQYILHLGRDEEDEAVANVFYNVLGRFLERLVAHTAPLPCATRCVSFHLVNLNEAQVDDGWSAAYFNHVLQLAEQAHALHPSLQLRGLVHGYNEEFGVMKRVLEFAFATETAELPKWEEDGGDMDATDEVVDDIFVNRSYDDDDV